MKDNSSKGEFLKTIPLIDRWSTATTNKYQLKYHIYSEMAKGERIITIMAENPDHGTVEPSNNSKRQHDQILFISSMSLQFF